VTETVPHIPVLLDEVLDALAIAPGQIHVDGTFGAGGYSRAMAGKGARVIAFDRDPDAIREGQAVAAANDILLIAGEFSRMRELLAEQGIESVSGLTLDIGVSSMQLDRADRGFSFQADGPLDMTMSQAGMNAADFLNEAAEEEIADVIYRYGDEPRSRRVARAIVMARPLERTAQLASVVRRALGHTHLPGDPHSCESRIGGTGARAGSGRGAAGGRRSPGDRHLPQPGGPHRQTVPAQSQRGRGGRIAPYARKAGERRADLRQAGQGGAGR
jgi:16S rRNA (cytosine(1402)-N(4))-methyltransferase